MKRRVGFGAFPRALAAGLQWKLWLLWFVFTMIPALMVTRPLHGMLSGLMDHSVHAGAWAKRFDDLAMSDVAARIMHHGISMLSTLFTWNLTFMLLLAPFLTGMSVTVARSGQRPGFGELMHGGLREYWRLLRFMLWALALLLVAFGLGIVGMHIAQQHAEQAVLQSQADFEFHVADAVMIVLVVIAHSMIEAGRGQIVADANLHSATRAFLRGIATLFRRPLATLGMYLGVSVIGVAIWILLGLWRIRLTAADWGGYVLAFVVTLLLVATLAWMRTARIAAMGSIARTRALPAHDATQ